MSDDEMIKKLSERHCISEDVIRRFYERLEEGFSDDADDPRPSQEEWEEHNLVAVNRGLWEEMKRRSIEHATDELEQKVEEDVAKTKTQDYREALRTIRLLHWNHPDDSDAELLTRAQGEALNALAKHGEECEEP